MGRARQLKTSIVVPGDPRLHLLFPGDEVSVRDALRTVLHAFRAMDIDPDTCEAAEIVLAEVLNNVVEHAYAQHGAGVIELEVDLAPDALAFRIRDDGAPMPDGEMPKGRAHDLEVDIAALPEGGFGWFLIRELTQDLSYRRSDNRNELRFRMALDAPAARPN